MRVELTDPVRVVTATTEVDRSGNFAVSGVVPGWYTLRFGLANGLSQWFHGRTSFISADLFQVRAGQRTVVRDRELHAGTIGGHLTYGSGQPAGDWGVEVRSTDDDQIVVTRTDDAGAYQVTVLPGRYRVQFATSAGTGMLLDWAHRATAPSQAQVFTVPPGGAVLVDEHVPMPGTLAGRLTDAAGHALVGARVTVSATENLPSELPTAETDESGRYQITLLPGRYLLAVYPAGQPLAQWLRGSLAREGATVFRVTEGKVTAADDRLLPTGTLVVSARDAVTGRPVARLCAEADAASGCSDPRGQVRLTGIRRGTQMIRVSSPDGRYLDGAVTVPVAAGRTTTVVLRLHPAAMITATVRDRATGTPVPGACVVPWMIGVFDWQQDPPESACSDQNGRLRAGPLVPGDYTLFVLPTGPYGAQWLGLRGGTGEQLRAAVIHARAGVLTGAPQIQLDRAGAVAGTITQAASHAPPQMSVASLNPMRLGVYGTGVFNYVGADGRYTLTGLGPYRWPLLFGSVSDAQQWSGGTGNRFAADTLQIVTGATATYDVAMQPGVILSGSVRTATGAPVTGFTLVFHNALTGDIMGSASGPYGAFRARLFGPQRVTVEYYVPGATGTVNGWYGGPDRAHAAVLTIPARGMPRLDLTIP